MEVAHKPCSKGVDERMQRHQIIPNRMTAFMSQPIHAACSLIAACLWMLTTSRVMHRSTVANIAVKSFNAFCLHTPYDTLSICNRFQRRWRPHVGWISFFFFYVGSFWNANPSVGYGHTNVVKHANTSTFDVWLGLHTNKGWIATYANATTFLYDQRKVQPVRLTVRLSNCLLWL